MPAFASSSAQHEPAGPPPTTATLSFIDSTGDWAFDAGDVCDTEVPKKDARPDEVTGAAIAAGRTAAVDRTDRRWPTRGTAVQPATNAMVRGEGGRGDGGSATGERETTVMMGSAGEAARLGRGWVLRLEAM